eukprot:TRINITY_DN19685_c0_g1_i1.p1 TRINITY_DN19685_c0_g1~~TRINITY_DN19685_c0_g1_i1.p1  ORF type:complete len:583 (+),score=214.97 TRINITY_DN19685_c0_g1_i1:62-1750(+)
MSDDDVHPVGSGGGEDDSDGDDMDTYPMNASKLPEGVGKEIITEAAEANWKKPKAGDEVEVHYVGTLQSDGSEFDSSRSRGKPFSFTLGQGQVIKGWDLGVASMKKGEVAKFTLAPEFAYGDGGSPPKIPAKATLVFEIELLDWKSKDDLFSDGGVIKTTLKEGSGWKTPKDGSEIKMALKVNEQDKGSLEYVLGSASLGTMSKAIDKALQGMKKGEQCTLACSKDYVPDDGGILELTLEELFEIADCSFAKDKSLMKKQVQEGEGFEKPSECAKVTLKIEAATDGTAPLPGFTAKTLEFVAGDGDVCDAIECTVLEMRKSERAVVTCTDPTSCKEEQLGLKDITGEKVVLTLQLLSFEKGTDFWKMSEEEKVEYGAARKEVGTKLFKAGRLRMAMDRYKKVCDRFSYTDNFKEENKKKANEVKKACTLNKAACQLKLKLFDDAKGSCNTVLKDDPSNIKALFRRAQADLALKNYADCQSDVKKIIELEPQNREARTLAKEAAAGQKEEDKKSKGMFGKMCQALGKGPIPEPYKDRRFDFDAEDKKDTTEEAEKDTQGEEKQ